jgi:hypothetical protein
MMISRSTAMPRHSRVDIGKTDEISISDSPEERVCEILKDFNAFDRTNRSPISPRKSLLRATDQSDAVSLGLPKTSPGNLPHHRHRKKSVRSKSTTVTGSLSTEPEESPASASTGSPKYVEEINKQLENENKRLKRMLRANTARHTSRQSGGSARKNQSEKSIEKLSEKAKTFKHQYKEERRNSMRMGKDLEAHHNEIEKLQFELAKALDTIDDLEKDQALDRAQLLKLTNELEEWRKKDAKTPTVKRLESEMRQRNDELDVTLEMLERKVERVVHLENELQKTKHRLRQYQKLDNEQDYSLDGSHNSYALPGSLSALSLMDHEELKAECKRLKRQNLTLKFLFEDLDKGRTIDEQEGLDALFQRVAFELSEFVASEEEGFNVSSQTDQGQCPTPGLSPSRNCSSVDDPSTDASSARAEALFQKEIERFNLEESSPCFSRGNHSTQPNRSFLVHPYDL